MLLGQKLVFVRTDLHRRIQDFLVCLVLERNFENGWKFLVQGIPNRSVHISCLGYVNGLMIYEKEHVLVRRVDCWCEKGATNSYIKHLLGCSAID